MIKTILLVAAIIIGLTLASVFLWSLMKAFADADREAERMMGVDYDHR